jgi:hypothetical protein
MDRRHELAREVREELRELLERELDADWRGGARHELDLYPRPLLRAKEHIVAADLGEPREFISVTTAPSGVLF